MKRKTLRRLKQPQTPEPESMHHHVYVVLLSNQALSSRKLLAANPRRDPTEPCVYVGMTGLSPTARFQNHKRGIKSAAMVHRYGLRLLPELYEMYNPMPYEAAVQMEKDLAADLRDQGYTVAGGV